MEYDREDIISVLRDLEILVVSLDRLGSAAPFVDGGLAAARIRDFVSLWQVGPRLARMRGVLSRPFSSEPGEDDMDDLERLMKDVPYWTEEHPDPPPSVQKNIWNEPESEEGR